MNKKRFFTKINKRGKLVIIDKDCNTELEDMYCACEVLNRLDLKRRIFIEDNEHLKKSLNYCEEGQQNLMRSKKFESDALDEIAAIIKRLGYD